MCLGVKRPGRIAGLLVGRAATLKGTLSPHRAKELADSQFVLGPAENPMPDGNSSTATPLDISIRRMSRQLPDSMHASVRRGLAKLDPSTDISSMFSCTGIFFKVLQQLQSFWKMEYDLPVGHKITFMCESDQDRADFLIKEFSPDAMICDANTVTNYRVKDTHTGKMVCLNHGRILDGGFSCTSKSSLNNNRTDHRRCLSDPKSTAATALTWKDLSSVIKEGKYECVFLENVVELMGGAAEDSDAKVILSELESYGFQC